MKTKLLLTVLIIAATLSGCEYNFTEDVNMDPITQGKVKKIFNGGNVECGQLSLIDPAFQNLSQTTGRNDYDASTKQFKNGWPTGLEVEVMPDGSVSWALSSGSIAINGKCYKIGAAIVKGSDASNIFYYGLDGATGDMGLFPPINSSGQPAGLSNLTFCFVECQEKEPIIIAIKSWYWLSEESRVNEIWADYTFTGSEGPNKAFFGTGNWCDNLGIYYYPGTTTSTLSGNVGTVKIEEGNVNGVHSLIITVDLNDGLVFDFTAIYAGDLAGLTGGPLYNNCPIYSAWPNVINTKVNTHVFTIPY